ncbi:MAG TPA: cytochrome C biogenesis protein [Helicobacteraceae bacterium]|nr:cytochrome C biogenesis protein [Helicobacteraceae bacterium]
MQESILALLESHSLLAFLGAFGAGSITAVAPCSLISVPLLVGSAATMNKDLQGREKVLYTYAFAGLFALGVMLSFSILGFMVAKFGSFFSIAPLWAYVLATIFSLLLGLYAWGVFGEVDKSGIILKLIKYRLFGGFLIGLIFGLVSTPCASAPLFAIVTVAANSGYVYAYALILTFALGHSILLLAAGISVGFAQSMTSNRMLADFSNGLNRVFALMLIAFGGYFGYQALLQL